MDLIVSDYWMPSIIGLELIETGQPKTPSMLSHLMNVYIAEEVKKFGERVDVYHHPIIPDRS